MMRFSKGCLVAALVSVVASVAPASADITGPGSTIPWNNKEWYLYGVDYPWYNYGTDFGTGGWGKYTDWGSTNRYSVNTSFATMRGEGSHIQRWWIFGDGRYNPKFNTDGTVKPLDSQFMSDLDTALRVADANDQYLLFVVLDNPMWSNAINAPPIQFGGHPGIVNNPTVQQSYLDNALKPLLEHVASSPYKNRVVAYDIVNEPEGQMAGYWGGTANLHRPLVQSFVQQCATYIHTYGGGAYATVGSAAPAFVATWKNLGLDFYQLHYYPWLDGHGRPGTGLPTYASLGLDRPCIVGEYATHDASYGLSDTNALSANWYVNTIFNDGYAGAIAWSHSSFDSATKWSLFNPVFTQWERAHSTIVGPQTDGSTTGGSTGGTSSGAGFPVVSGTDPNQTRVQAANGPGLTVIVNGSNFENNLSVVKWNGVALPTRFIDVSRLIADIPASDLTALTAANITVTNNPAGANDPAAGDSNSVAFHVGMSYLAVGIAWQGVAIDTTTGDLVIKLKIANLGRIDAENVQLTSATLATRSSTATPGHAAVKPAATASLPAVGTIPHGGSVTTTLRFPGGPWTKGTAQMLKVNGSFTNFEAGTFGGNLQVTTP